MSSFSRLSFTLLLACIKISLHTVPGIWGNKISLRVEVEFESAGCTSQDKAQPSLLLLFITFVCVLRPPYHSIRFVNTMVACRKACSWNRNVTLCITLCFITSTKMARFGSTSPHPKKFNLYGVKISLTLRESFHHATSRTVCLNGEWYLIVVAMIISDRKPGLVRFCRNNLQCFPGCSRCLNRSNCVNCTRHF